MIINSIHDYENISKRYVFRGQSKDWPLLPSAYRSNSNVNCIAVEKEAVNRFIKDLQENGHRDFSCELNQFDFLTKYTEIFPTEEILSYWALAQHYALDSQFYWLKTSILDVTHNLDIAAWFAVHDKKYENYDGNIYVFDPSIIKEPYKYYLPPGGFRLAARLLVQDCAFIYRVQKYEHASEYEPYKDKESFDDIVINIITIPCELKSQLKDYLQKKLFESLMFPRLILKQVVPNLATAGSHSAEELKEINKPAVIRAENLGDKHDSY